MSSPGRRRHLESAGARSESQQSTNSSSAATTNSAASSASSSSAAVATATAGNYREEIPDNCVTEKREAFINSSSTGQSTSSTATGSKAIAENKQLKLERINGFIEKHAVESQDSIEFDSREKTLEFIKTHQHHPPHHHHHHHHHHPGKKVQSTSSIASSPGGISVDDIARGSLEEEPCFGRPKPPQSVKAAYKMPQTIPLPQRDQDIPIQKPDTNQNFKTHLFVTAGSDRECIGCDPFSQRLFMILWLKGIVFNVTTVDKTATPRDLREIAPGTNPPFLLFNGEVLTDVMKIEDFLEAELNPPKYPRLACRHAEATVAGNDVFQKFSAWIKANNDNKIINDRFINSLRKLNTFLNTPLGYEGEQIDPKDGTSQRLFLDGDQMTLADCNMLPKLHILTTAGRTRKQWSLPAEFKGIMRYMSAALDREEFRQTCADELEIDFAYGGRGRRPTRINR